MKRKYDLAIFIGRFQPLHNGHVHNIEKGLEIADNVLVILGSANQPRTPKNPFTVQERTDLIKEIFPSGRVTVRSVEDYLYQDTRWVQSIQAVVHHHIVSSPLAHRLQDEDGLVNPADAKITVLGHEKDSSSYYLKMFPTWDYTEIPKALEHDGKVVGGTEIRNAYFGGGWGQWSDTLPREVMSFLFRFSDTADYTALKKEYEYITRYKEEWSNTPYPVTFFTTDAVVIQSGHILLVKRKTEPGKGQWALPGGFLDEGQRVKDSMIRELKEETKIAVPPAVLRGSIKAERLFDAPNRSLRGRTLTQAYLIDLPDQPQLPKVKGADDAEKAKWFPLDMVSEMTHCLFEDHQSIIQMMVSLTED